MHNLSTVPSTPPADINKRDTKSFTSKMAIQMLHVYIS